MVRSYNMNSNNIGDGNLVMTSGVIFLLASFITKIDFLFFIGGILGIIGVILALIEIYSLRK